MDSFDLDVGSNKLNDALLHIAGVPVKLDQSAAYDILIAISQLHSRCCDEIGNCGDMHLSNVLAKSLVPITVAYNHIEDVVAFIDEREAVHV